MCPFGTLTYKTASKKRINSEREKKETTMTKVKENKTKLMFEKVSKTIDLTPLQPHQQAKSSHLAKSQ